MLFRRACCQSPEEFIYGALFCRIASLQAQSRKMAGRARPNDDNCIIFHRFANDSASRPSSYCTLYSSCAAALLKKFKH
ncbi:hypothetical protein BEN74_03540 [Acinetobacter sp. WCHAc010034]|nr:hypothetical protein BEN74_03540 [Acinetobacter sp. WCHAc010034]